MQNNLQMYVALGMQSHIIPIVPPDATLSPNSSLDDNDKGKQPGQYYPATGLWSGRAGWASGYTTYEDLTEWSTWPTENYGLRTAYYPSVDVDVDDVILAQQINTTIDLFIPNTATRSRDNSPRVVRVFKLADGETIQGKRCITLHDSDAKVELLGGGQQVALSGTHPSGAQYGFVGVPIEVTVAQLDQLWDAIIAVLGDKVKKVTKAGDIVPGQNKGGKVVHVATDQATKDHALGYVNRLDDVVEGERDDTCYRTSAYIRQHYGLTVEDTLQLMYHWNNTKVAPPLSDRVVLTKVNSVYSGNVTGAQGEYHWSAAGFGQCTEIPQGLSDKPIVVDESEIPVKAKAKKVDQKLDIPMSPTGVYPISQRIGKAEWDAYHITSNGMPQSTLINFKIMLQCYQINIGYDVIAKKPLMSGPGISAETDVSDNANLAFIYNLCKMNYLETTIINQYIHILQNEHQVNPVEAWVHDRVWDGMDRIWSLFETLTLAPEQDVGVAYMMFRKWLIGAVKIAQGKIKRFEFVLVLQDDLGGEGKTRWFNTLCPEPWQADGILLKPDDKDSIKQAVSYWLVELGELDSIFRKSDVKTLMAFLSKSKDEIRLPYAQTYSKFQRRTAYFGSVNSKQFLVDDSGDRRFWPIAVTAVDYEHNIDMQQVWAQVDTLDEIHWLNREENKTIIKANKAFKALDPIEETLESFFRKTPIKEGEQHLTVTIILKMAGIDKPTKGQLNKSANWLRRSGYNYTSIQGVRGFTVPIISMMY